ncbi:hypothetical protein SLEP1_g58353 [Rubroshorea leprosula]|uniref:Uncharacterized protein n=1 Tax=Rubroshorea leprosula TaxID=152421 RepID=A0AAV5MQ32_9ROSI|nr:hypothetical protein SLEP1_g58353 [Rubroshorea leprosula]
MHPPLTLHRHPMCAEVSSCLESFDTILRRGHLRNISL